MGTETLSDGELMQIIPIHARHVDYAWRDGAYLLGESCVEECTVDQLKLLISRGERQLVRMDDEGKTVGWGVYIVLNMPNFNVLFITNMWARKAHFERFYGLLKQMAQDLGCSRIRCCAQPAQARLYAMKLDFKPVYTTLEAEVL